MRCSITEGKLRKVLALVVLYHEFQERRQLAWKVNKWFPKTQIFDMF